LKSAQLQHIARATGIQSSGTKSVLVERIATELGSQSAIDDSVAESEPSPGLQARQADFNRSQSRTLKNKANTANAKSSKSWSILSIDMGIQNLAFAHLRVPHSTSASAPIPELTAWHRLAVSDIASLNLTGLSKETKIPQSVLSDSEFPLIGATETQTKGRKPKSNKKKALAKAKDSFSPDLYAATAYNLLTSLLTAYRPTHILIERQRFRSGGASAVQEWTLRVGVFEGMLHAILYALRKERGDGMVVKGVEPKRVVGYWLEGERGKEKEKEKLNARAVKKAKIDLVGRWLGAAVNGGKEEVVAGVQAEAGKIGLADRAEAPVLHGIVGAYLRKLKGEAKSKKTRALKDSSVSVAPAEDVVDLGKLDDLADCLLQGVAWIEWQGMRERIAKEGFQALGVDPSESKPKRKSSQLESSTEN
jgi:cruciform cutting endonuclease 1